MRRRIKATVSRLGVLCCRRSTLSLLTRSTEQNNLETNGYFIETHGYCNVIIHNFDLNTVTF
jgi:hypothetical protein